MEIYNCRRKQFGMHVHLGAICALNIDRTTSKTILDTYDTFMHPIVEQRFLVDYDKMGQANSFAIWREEPGWFWIIDIYSMTGEYIRLYHMLRARFSVQTNYICAFDREFASGEELRFW